MRWSVELLSTSHKVTDDLTDFFPPHTTTMADADSPNNSTNDSTDDSTDDSPNNSPDGTGSGQIRKRTKRRYYFTNTALMENKYKGQMLFRGGLAIGIGVLLVVLSNIWADAPTSLKGIMMAVGTVSAFIGILVVGISIASFIWEGIQKKKGGVQNLGTKFSLSAYTQRFFSLFSVDKQPAGPAPILTRHELL